MRMQQYIKRWRALWNPDMYHGWGKQKHYFEGWYCKVVSPKQDYAFAFIPGISMEEDGQQHAFIQVLDGVRCTATYHNFGSADFQPDAHQFALQLGKNFFSAQKVEINLPNIKGQLKFTGHHPWPKMLGAPGIMGWYSFVPFMECYHGVVSMHHRIEGELEVDEQAVDFNGGVGYMEKDWGKSFPNAWIWMQSNHFEQDPAISLMASVANIPWLGNHFVGYLVGFQWGERLYRFATYTGAKMKAQLGKDEVLLHFKDRRYQLDITAHKGPGGHLVSPISGQMKGKVNESMQARLDIRFFDRGELIFEGTGRSAGLEVAGKTDKLLTNKWRR
ncbi:MAG: tocopherol cyclase family protein [Bacteroidota bacterium]